jgi:universal stress protein A
MYQHILLASDLSAENQDTLKKTKQLLDLFPAKLSIMHAVEPILNYGYVGITDIEQQLVDDAKKALAKIGKQLGVAPEDQWIAVGPSKREILSMAEELKVDLLILGSHSEHSFANLLGSTTNGVLHHAHCDVLTIRHWKKRKARA